MPRKRHPRTNPHAIVLQVKLWAIELVAAIIFFKWLISVFLREMKLK